MKRLPLLFVSLALVTGSLLRADDPNNLVKNGDFAAGAASWEGDVHTPDADRVDPLSTTDSTPTGVCINLRSSDWSRVSQNFACPSRVLAYRILYKLSADATFSTRDEDYDDLSGAVGSTLWKPFATPSGKWTVVVVDVDGKKFFYSSFSPAFGNDQAVQVAQGKVRLKPGDTKGIYLLFPPGTGTVTLLGITVVPISKKATD